MIPDALLGGYLPHAMDQMNFSARAHDRILKVFLTLAELAGKKTSPATRSSKPSNSVHSAGRCSNKKSFPCRFGKVAANSARDEAWLQAAIC